MVLTSTCQRIYLQNVLDHKITLKLKAFHNGIFLKSVGYGMNYIFQQG